MSLGLMPLWRLIAVPVGVTVRDNSPMRAYTACPVHTTCTNYGICLGVTNKHGRDLAAWSPAVSSNAKLVKVANSRMHRLLNQLGAKAREFLLGNRS
jgi:hypothetical protein